MQQANTNTNSSASNSTPTTSNSKSVTPFKTAAEMLSEQTKNKLNQISAKIDEQLSKKGKTVSTYIKFDYDGCRKVLKFDPNRTEETEVDYPNTTAPVES